MLTYLDFEKPIAELETKVAELRETASSTDIDIDAEVGRLETKANKLLRDTYAQADARGRRRRSRGTPSGRTSRIMSRGLRTISCRSPATARSPTTRRSSAGWRGSTAGE